MSYQIWVPREIFLYMDEKRLKDVGDYIGAVLNDNLGLYYETYTGNGTSADWTNFCLTLRNILRTD